MLEREPFLRAIFADPDNDLPRLVFADYLEERGDGAWAEFIRVQCEYARRLPDPFAEIGEWQREEQRLFEELDADLKAYSELRDFWRGFRRYPSIDIDAEELTDPEELRRRAVAAHPEWYGATRLKVVAGRVTLPAQLATLFTNPVTERVTELDLSGRLEEVEAPPPEAGDDFTFALRDMEFHPAIIGTMVEALARMRECRRLTDLDLSNNDLDNDAARAIAGSPHLFRLKRLAFSQGNRFKGRTWQQLIERFGRDVVH